MLNALFVFEIPTFLTDFLVITKNGLIRKLRSVPKFMISLAAQQIITIHILPNISRSKCNQTMKFGQLIEYDMRNLFLEKSYKKCGREAGPKSFSIKSKLNISPDQQSEMLSTV